MPLPTFSTLGSGPTVLFLHGSFGGHRAFAPQLETFAGHGYRAVAWDMPGFGHSAPIEPYAFKGLAERCAALIEALGAGGDAPEPVVLVGQGLGGMVAQEVALRRPELVRQLVLVATVGTVREGDAYHAHAARCLAALDRAATDATTTAATGGTGATGPAAIATAEAAALIGAIVSPHALPAGVQLARYCLSQVHPGTWRRALGALTAFDRQSALGHVRAPTLLLAGDDDPLAPVAAMRPMAEAIGGARLVALPHAGHLPQLERPDEFDALTLDFLRHARAWLH